EREEARGDARAGAVFEEVVPHEREAALLAALDRDLAEPHLAVRLDVRVEVGRRLVLARELAPDLLEDLVRDAARLDEVLHDLADEGARDARDAQRILGALAVGDVAEEDGEPLVA